MTQPPQIGWWSAFKSHALIGWVSAEWNLSNENDKLNYSKNH